MKRIVVTVLLVVGLASPAAAQPARSCVRALDRAEGIITLHVAFARAVSAYLSTQDQTAFAAEVEQLTRGAGPIIDQFRVLSRKCRRA